MLHVLILTDEDWIQTGLEGDGSPVQPYHDLRLGIHALKRAILAEGSRSHSLHITTPAAALELEPTLVGQVMLCPLTLHLPPHLPFAGQALYQTCLQVDALRDWVSQHLHFTTGVGNLWLPIVWTLKGPLYGEVIARKGDRYIQPVHLSDRQRQPLYRLAYRLLSSLHACPSVYLVQFALEDDLSFDRLYPFPAVPAIASLGIQTPDLLTCYWHCLMARPIRDLVILPSAECPSGARSTLEYEPM